MREVRETEKPNVSGCAAKRRFRIVDLPVPDGPEITTGRGGMVVGAIVVMVLSFRWA